MTTTAGTIPGTAQSARRQILRFLPNLGGPILVKEILIASRRGRTFLTRLGYLMLLTLFVAITWISTTGEDSSTGFSMYQMSAAGRSVITTIAWFQFVVVPILAVVTLSTSISDELYHGTLGILMTTPITNFQLVAGKLGGKLLQLASLVAMSVPLLAVVRVFGGVPWGIVVSSAFVTLSMAAFAGAITIFYSILFRKAYVVILISLGTLTVLYIVLPLILSMVAGFLSFVSASNIPWSILLHIHSLAAMIGLTTELYSPGSMKGVFFFWPLHVLVTGAMTAAVLIACAALVRKVSLRRAFGPTYVATYLPPVPAWQVQVPPVIAQSPMAGHLAPADAPPLPQTPASTPPPPPRRTSAFIREVTDPAMLWKECRVPIFGDSVLAVLALSALVLLALLLYVLLGALGSLSAPGVQASFAVSLLVLAMMATAVLAAVGVSTEKESRTLPILLTTPVSDWNILLAKAVGVLRRSSPAWIFLGAHVLVFAAVTFIHPMAVLHITMIVAWTVTFIVSAGLYLGTIYKRTTPAVIATLGLPALLWVLGPVLTGWPLTAMGLGAVYEFLLTGNPLVQTVTLTCGATWHHGFNYDWAGGHGAFRATLTLAGWMVFYGVVSALLLLRAGKRLRSNAF